VNIENQFTKFHRPMTDEEKHRAKVEAYWMLFLAQNACPDPSPDGSYFLGSIDDARVKAWEKDTPYSPARRTSGRQGQEILRHEACHVATWAETEEHGTERRSCMVKLGADK
jgi:hypothetical protein